MPSTYAIRLWITTFDGTGSTVSNIGGSERTARTPEIMLSWHDKRSQEVRADVSVAMPHEDTEIFDNLWRSDEAYFYLYGYSDTGPTQTLNICMKGLSTLLVLQFGAICHSLGLLASTFLRMRPETL
ncbi:hypothetical protein PR048_002621 [Dryococelus australis]|uniref:Uncharacterized protein n=1 Tax=Dryococelus australis TaxID=614101 RepID=A0ABQ9IKP0_9NEOP|nr:hypothetical protein PR048_002621 [Dryococelus australis]